MLGSNHQSKLHKQRIISPTTKICPTDSKCSKAVLTIVHRKKTKSSTIPELQSSPTHLHAICGIGTLGDDSENGESNEKIVAAPLHTGVVDGVVSGELSIQ